MKIVLRFVLFLVLWSGRPGVTGGIDVYKVKEGHDIRIRYYAYQSGFWKYFCRNDCKKQEDILVKTSSNKDNGRYSIEFKYRSLYPDEMFVSIRNVTLSDTGTYRCALGTRDRLSAFADFIINVSSDGSSSPSPGVLSPETPSASEPREDHTPLSDVALYVGVSLSALLILSLTLTSLILYWRKRAGTAPGPPEIPVYAQIPQNLYVYEEIPANSKQSRGAPEELSSASLSNTTHSCDIYSLCSAPAAPQRADSSSTVTYSEVDFSKRSSAPRCPTATTEEAPVYSTVSLPQK